MFLIFLPKVLSSSQSSLLSKNHFIIYLQIQSFPRSGRYSNFLSFSFPLWCFSHSSVDSMFSRVIFLFFHHLRSLSIGRDLSFFINSHSFARKKPVFWWLFNEFTALCLLLRFFVIYRRSKINLHISVDNTNGLILIFGLDLQNINIKFARKSRNCDCIPLV